MFNSSIETFAMILKDEKLKELVECLFDKVIVAVATGDSSYLCGDIESVKKVMNVIFNIPNMLYWDKMKRYLTGAYLGLDARVKLSERFLVDYDEYTEFVKKQMMLVNQINDERKIDYFASLTRCLLITKMDFALYYKLFNFIYSCTAEELDYLKNWDFSNRDKLNTYISCLYYQGLFKQVCDDDGVTYYKLSDFGIALKIDCLNFDEDLKVKQITSYESISPIDISESIPNSEIDKLFED